MRYKITKQFIQDRELPLAEFDDINNANLFLEAKLNSKIDKSLKLIYRLFDEDKVIRKYTHTNIKEPIAAAQYADGNTYLPEDFAKPFKVCTTKDNKESAIAKFCQLEDAQLFAEMKVSKDIELGRDEAYIIYNASQYLKQIDKSIFESPQGQGQEKKQVFRPTPFSMKPRLGPPNWIVEEDKDED